MCEYEKKVTKTIFIFFVHQLKTIRENKKHSTMTGSLSSKSQTSLFTMTPDKRHLDSFIFANGDRYDGEYMVANDGQIMRHGYGKHISADQQFIYEGLWNQDKMHGTGRLTFPNGTSYEGEFQSNFYQGLGTYTWPDGAQYAGRWQDSKAIGKAEYLKPNLGVIFVGIADGKGVHMRYKVDFPENK
jgi:hypothetical protein